MSILKYMEEIKKLGSTKKGNVKVIYHLADIHIKNYNDDHGKLEQKIVFERLYDKIKNDCDIKNSVIVICGDLLHQRTTLTSESIVAFKNFIDYLCDLTDVCIILGNHDHSSHNYDKMDLVSSLVHSMSHEKNKVFMLKKSGIYEYNNILFGVTSVYSEKIQKCPTIENKINVGLYHGYIHGASIQNDEIGHMVGRFNQGDFSEYEIVCLGDIHKMQTMRNETMAYPSSLIQQNHGEEIVNHGFMRWDLNKMKCEFVNVKSDYCYLTVSIDKKGIHIPCDIKDIPKNIRLKVDHESVSLNEVDAHINKLKEKFNVIDETRNRKFKSIDLDISDPTDINNKITEFKDKKDIINLVMRYVDKNIVMKNEDKIKMSDKINEILSSLRMNEKISKTTRKIELEEMEFCDIFIYGKKNKINFKNLNGIVGLHAPNKHGKTSLINIIIVAIWGPQSGGNINLIDYIHTEKQAANTTITANVNNVKYKIVREIKKKGKDNSASSSVSVYKYINNEEKKISTEEIAKTNELIETLFGERDDFLKLNIIMQEEPINFLSMTDDKKKMFLNKLFKLDIIKEVQKEAESENKQIIKSIREIEIDIEKLAINKTKEDKAKITIELEDLINKKRKLIENIDTIKKTKMLLEEKIKEYNILKDSKNNINFTEIANDLKSFRKESNEKDSIIKSLKSKIDKIITTKKNITEEMKKYVNIEEKRKKFEIDKKKRIEDQEEIYNRFAEQIQNIDDENNINVENHNKYVSTKRNELGKNIEIIKEHKFKLKTYNEQLGEPHKLPKTIEKIVKIYEAAGIEIQEYIDLKNKMVANMNNMEKQLEKMDDIKYNKDCDACMNNSHTKQKIRYEIDIVDHKVKINNFDKKIVTTQNIISKNKKKYDLHKKNEEIEHENVRLNDLICRLNEKKDIIEKENEFIQKSIDDTREKIIKYEKYVKVKEDNDKIKNTMKLIRENIKKINTEKYMVYDDYILCREMNDKNNEELEKISTELEINNSRYNIVQDKIKILEKNEEKINDFMKKDAMYKNDKEEFKQLCSQLQIYESKYEKFDKNIDDNKKKIYGAENICMQHEKLVNKKKEKQSMSDVCENIKKTMGKGGLTDDLLKTNILKLLETSVNNVLSNIEDYNLKITFDRNNNIKIDKVDREDNNKILNAHLNSSHEKTMINFAFRLSFGKITNFLETNFFIMDETLKFTDSNNMIKMTHLFQYIRSNYSWCIMITHNDLIKSNFDKEINIAKQNGASKLIF